MITYLHHTHPSIPKYAPEDWTFILGATATMDRDFGLIGTHFFHRISSDHVTHHLFSKIPHYYARDATNALAPLLGEHYKRGTFGWSDLRLAFSNCQWVQEDELQDEGYFYTEGRPEFGLNGQTSQQKKVKKALWYKAGPSPAPEYRQRVDVIDHDNVPQAE